MKMKQNEYAEALRGDVQAQRRAAKEQIEREPTLLESLTRQLQDKDKDALEREAYLSWLAELGEPAAEAHPDVLPAVQGALDDSDDDVQQAALRAAASMGRAAASHSGMLRAIARKVHPSKTRDAALAALLWLPVEAAGGEDREAAMAALTEGGFRQEPAEPAGIERAMAALRRLLARPGLAAAAGGDREQRPADLTADRPEPDGTVDGLAWRYVADAARGGYFVFETDDRHLRNEAFRVSLSDSRTLYLLLARSTDREGISLGFAPSPGAENVRPTAVEPLDLEDLLPEERAALAVHLQALAGWDELGWRAWPRWLMNQPAEAVAALERAGGQAGPP